MEPWFAALARPTATVPGAAAHNDGTARNDDRPRSIIPMDGGYNTPDEAALAGFPRGQARVVRVRTSFPACCMTLGTDEVEVELMTNEPPHEYPYFVHVERHHNQWIEAVSHN